MIITTLQLIYGIIYSGSSPPPRSPLSSSQPPTWMAVGIFSLAPCFCPSPQSPPTGQPEESGNRQNHLTAPVAFRVKARCRCDLSRALLHTSHGWAFSPFPPCSNQAIRVPSPPSKMHPTPVTSLFLFLRERETSMCCCLSCAPYWGPGPQPRHVPCLGIETGNLSVSSLALSPLSHTCQGSAPGFIGYISLSLFPYSSVLFFLPPFFLFRYFSK